MIPHRAAIRDVDVVVFRGTVQEAHELALAVSHNCDCDAQKRRCGAHEAILSQRTVDGLLFARWLVERLLLEEFR